MATALYGPWPVARSVTSDSPRVLEKNFFLSRARPRARGRYQGPGP